MCIVDQVITLVETAAFVFLAVKRRRLVPK